jgi:quinol monooxygenase YgiN
MAYVVAAIWTAKEGQEEKILEVIKKMTPLSRQEPGCLYYQAQRSPDNPRVFFLYEQYVDAPGRAISRGCMLERGAQRNCQKS